MNKMSWSSLILASLAGSVVFGPVAFAVEPLPDVVQFNRDIRQILSDNCFHCHGPDAKHRQASLRLDEETGAFAKLENGVAIKPGDLKHSLLWQRITSADPDEKMPPAESNKKLTARQIGLLQRWIEQGAKWEGHWAFLPPKQAAAPQAKNPGWVRNPIDAFVLAHLEREKLQPSLEASRELLLRRVTFDLTGLPPTLAEREAFLADTSPQAYEKLIDRLLASPHFGERMALVWLDAARYGDTSVFHADGPRDMWAWRDWVIKAYNTNMPFNQFTIEQLAGDLLPNATRDQQVASGFNRNHGTTDEGGAIAEEYRVEYVVDRVKTTSTVWLGLTLECGQCHDHKYDPLTQKEYYQFYAFFNNTTDAGMQTRSGNATPLVTLPNLDNEAKAADLRKQLAEIELQLQTHAAAGGPAFDAWLENMIKNADKELAPPMDFVAYFPLDDEPGNKISDVADAKRQGKVNGKTPSVPGKFGQALTFDGKSFVDLGDIGNFERTQSFSYSVWVFAEDNAIGAPLARMDDGNDYRGFDLYLNGGRASVHLIHKWPENAIKVTTKNQFKPKEWHHYFVSYDGTSKAAGLKIYVDGQEQAWGIDQDSLRDTMCTDKPLYLGRRNPGSPFKGLVDDVRIYSRALSPAEVSAVAGSNPIASIVKLAAEARTKEQNEALRTHYFVNHDPKHKQLTGQVAAIKKQEADLSKPLTTVMMMQDLPQMRKTYVLNRGDYGSPKTEEEILPGTPSFLPPMPAGAPKNRLGLAQWLTADDHPLTGRMAVNRLWQMVFGTGLVPTAEDFGSQGLPPNHPELLDWLATDFVSHGWDVKRALKQILMSATYRQSSKVTPELIERDPGNRHLARGPRFRLQGEFIRDNALALGGLIVPKVGGPSVKPYQPPGLWEEVALDGGRYVPDHGENLYRRSMYTYWRRSAPAPSMLIFDAPTREKCAISRQRTNTPLQALVTLNDPQFVEAARALAQRIMKEGGDSPEARVRFAYRLATCRDPRDNVLRILVDTYQKQLARFQADPPQAAALLKVGESPRDMGLDAAQHAAWTVVASMLLNLDETLNKG